jgi:hypothetical protein
MQMMELENTGLRFHRLVDRCFKQRPFLAFNIKTIFDQPVAHFRKIVSVIGEDVQVEEVQEEVVLPYDPYHFEEELQNETVLINNYI